MKRNITILSLLVILFTLSACHQKNVKSVVTPLTPQINKEVSSLILLPLSEQPHNGWAEVIIVDRKWYFDTNTVLTRNELASMSFGQSNEGNWFLQISPNKNGQLIIDKALENKNNYILMVLNGKAISLSQLNSAKTLSFYVGDENKTIQIAEAITQKNIMR